MAYLMAFAGGLSGLVAVLKGGAFQSAFLGSMGAL